MSSIFEGFFNPTYTGPSHDSVESNDLECSDPQLLVAANIYNKPEIKINVINKKPIHIRSELSKALNSLAMPAYTESGVANFLDENGSIKDGIYLDLPSDIYHKLTAYGSSHFKTYINSSSHYFEKYLSDTKKTSSISKHFDVGDITHELVLEGSEAVAKRRFILIDPEDYPIDMHTGADLKAECEKQKVKTSGTIRDKAERLSVIPSSTRMYFDFRQLQHIKNNIGSKCFNEISKQLTDEDITITADSVVSVIKTGKLVNQPLKLPVIPSDFKEAIALHAGMVRNKFAQKLFKNGVPEVTFLVTDPVTGLKLKCRTDWLSFLGDTTLPVDLKTARSCNPAVAAYQFAELSYDIQAVFYLYVIKLAGLETPKRQFPFVTLEKGPSAICEIFELHESDWEQAENTLPKLLKSFKEFMDSRLVSGYTKDGISVIKLAKRKNGFFLDK